MIGSVTLCDHCGYTCITVLRFCEALNMWFAFVFCGKCDTNANA